MESTFDLAYGGEEMNYSNRYEGHIRLSSIASYDRWTSDSQPGLLRRYASRNDKRTITRLRVIYYNR